LLILKICTHLHRIFLFSFVNILVFTKWPFIWHIESMPENRGSQRVTKRKLQEKLKALFLSVHERKLGDDEESTPSMAEFTVEAVFGKLSVGYTGRYLMEGFFMYQNVLYNSLAYQGNSENRLENSLFLYIFNFI